MDQLTPAEEALLSAAVEAGDLGVETSTVAQRTGIDERLLRSAAASLYLRGHVRIGIETLHATEVFANGRSAQALRRCT